MENLTLVAKSPTTWWGCYEAALLESSLSPTSRQVIKVDSQYLLDQGVNGAGAAGSTGWPDSRFRSGLVMGAVQSGKTASMLGLAAMSMDSGVDIVVVLAGTRIALWRQTYERLSGQLFARKRGILLPDPGRMLQSEGDLGAPATLFNLPTARVSRALREREPMVLVVMKHGQHIRAAAKMLHDRAYRNLEALGRPLHILVLDDEADDGSILDAAVESAVDPVVDHLKQIPRHVVDLWATRSVAPATAHSALHATYIAYTATPQANILQSDVNPLAPRDFVATLRTPYDTGLLHPRSTTYDEPRGYSAYYTGGESFYHRVGAGDALIVSQTDTSDLDMEGRQSWIAKAVRAWLVAAAIRLMRDDRGRRYQAVRELVLDDEAALTDLCPSPHTMLVHPSPAVSDHFEALAEILAWARDVDLADARELVDSGVRELSVEALERDMEEHPEAWSSWLGAYAASAKDVRDAFELEDGPVVPGEPAWPEVRALMLGDIIPNVRLAVVNSDPNADERPQFVPQIDAGGWRAPADLLTIFVSGNVMARGLTLEGLATTLFLRTSADPAADTQMQMQRWFGYRGSFLELCRVFLPETQKRLFQQYHDADEALRRQVVSAMNQQEGAPSPLVLEGQDFRATGKIQGVGKVPLSPGATPFVSLVNSSAEPDPNVELLVSTFQDPSHDLWVGDTLRGRILDHQLSLDEAAALLDRFSYSAYAPDRSDPLSTRWDSLQAQLGLTEDSLQPQVPLFRPPATAVSSVGGVVPPSRCPYSIAAYLRLWSACLTRHARGLFPTDNPDSQWSLLDLGERQALQPRFYVGLRYGEVSPIAPDAPGGTQLSGLHFAPRPVVRREGMNGVLASTWGSRNPGNDQDAYKGDQLFDYHEHKSLLLPDTQGGGPLWRPLGAPGLLLFHLIRNHENQFPVVALGVALPLGGPDHFAARPRR